jgi:hypothetical protein
MHETIILPCRAGCGAGIDAVHHYMNCEALWSTIYSFLNMEYIADLAARLGIAHHTTKEERSRQLVALTTAFFFVQTQKQKKHAATSKQPGRHAFLSPALIPGPEQGVRDY